MADCSADRLILFILPKTESAVVPLQPGGMVAGPASPKPSLSPLLPRWPSLSSLWAPATGNQLHFHSFLHVHKKLDVSDTPLLFLLAVCILS